MFSIRPYMCTPQPVQAWRWIVLDASTTLSFWPFAVTTTLSRGTTATMLKVAPSGFQHWVQPQTWLCAVFEPRVTSTLSVAQWQLSVPPAKSALPALTPPSTAGWIDAAMGFPSLVFLRCLRLGRGPV